MASPRAQTLAPHADPPFEHGIVTREFYGEHPPRAQYALTDKGRDHGPVVRTLRDWNTAHTRREK